MTSKISFFFFTLLCTSISLAPSLSLEAQTLTLEQAINKHYCGESLENVTPLPEGSHYAQLSKDHTRITQHLFASGKEDGMLFDVKTIKDCPFEKIDGFILSPDGRKMLIQTETKQGYRHSHTAIYYIYYIGNKKVERLSDGGPQECPVWDTNGEMVAFVRQNNIYLVKLLFNNSESKVTKDGKINSILNGKPDWVYEEEFSYDRAIAFSPDGTMLCWTRWDESKVKEYQLLYFKGQAPELEENALYPKTTEYKYPKAGTSNATVSVLSYDIKSHVIRTLALPLQGEEYIPRIQFTKESDKLAVVILNRNQTQLDLYFANPRSGISKLILRDQAKYYISEKNLDFIRFYDGYFSYLSEKDGYNHLYWYQNSGTLAKQVTKGEYEVSEFYGYSPETALFYYRSNEGDPTRSAVYSIDLKGKKTCLTPEPGRNSALFASNYAYFINTHSSLKEVPTASIYTQKGKKVTTLLANEVLEKEVSQLKETPQLSLFSFTTTEGVKLNGWMMKPANLSETKKYPVVLYQYSGPKSQQVLDQWNIGITGSPYGFEAYLATQGYVVVCIDGRGTGGRGADFSGCTYQKLGMLEADDQVATAHYLSSLSYVDSKRIGIYGWSFGGTCTLMSLMHPDGIFKAGVAVAPVTNWSYYDTAYGERYMRTPQQNADGYKMASPLARVKDLKGSLLLVHGLADDNVHYQNTAELAEQLVQAGKDFDMMVYTNRNHQIAGGNTRMHLFNKIANFFKKNL